MVSKHEGIAILSQSFAMQIKNVSVNMFLQNHLESVHKNEQIPSYTSTLTLAVGGIWRLALSMVSIHSSHWPLAFFSKQKS